MDTSKNLIDVTLAALRAFISAQERHGVEAVIACFAPGIVIRSPIKQRVRFEGIEQASDLFCRVHAARIFISDTAR